MSPIILSPPRLIVSLLSLRGCHCTSNKGSFSCVLIYPLFFLERKMVCFIHTKHTTHDQLILNGVVQTINIPCCQLFFILLIATTNR